MNTRILKTAVAVICVFIGYSANAEALTYSEWQQEPEQWKRGYAYAIVDVQMSTSKSNRPEDRRIPEGIQKCVGNNQITDTAFVQIIDNYFIRHPEAIAQPFIFAALNSLAEVCKPYIEQK